MGRNRTNKMNGLIFVVLVAVFGYSQAYPIHASCKIQWTFGVTCDQVKTKLKAQIDAWKDDSNCPNAAGEECLYTYISDTDTELKAKHATPVKHYKDDLTFSF